MSRKLGCYLGYTGSKIRYKEEVEAILPKEKHLKVLEPFAGGFSLSHLYDPSWEITANDSQKEVIGLHKKLQSDLRVYTPSFLAEAMKNYCHAFVSSKSKSDKEAYSRLRDYYNNDPHPYSFYALVCSSFSNQIRFCNKGLFNLPNGGRYFNPNKQKNFLAYLEALKQLNVKFTSGSYEVYDFTGYDLLVIDPPYSYNGKSLASYNEGGGWQLRDLVTLLSKLDKAHEAGVKFVVFNELITKGEDNLILQEWTRKYKTTVLRDTITGCNYQRTDKRSVEVMITNY